MELNSKGVSTLVTVFIVLSIALIGMAWLQTTLSTGSTQQETIQRANEIIDTDQKIQDFQRYMQESIETEAQEATDRVARQGGRAYRGSNYQNTYWVCANTAQIPDPDQVQSAIASEIVNGINQREAAFPQGNYYIDKSEAEITLESETTADSSNDQFNVTTTYPKLEAGYIPEGADGIQAMRSLEDVEFTSEVSKNRFWYMYSVLRDWASNPEDLADTVRNEMKYIPNKGVKPSFCEIADKADPVSALKSIPVVGDLIKLLEAAKLLGIISGNPVTGFFSGLNLAKLADLCGYGAAVVYGFGGSQSPLTDAQAMGQCIAQRGSADFDSDRQEQFLDLAVKNGMYFEMAELEEELAYFNNNSVNCRVKFNNHPDGQKFPGYRIDVDKNPLFPGRVSTSFLGCAGVPVIGNACVYVCDQWNYHLLYEAYLDFNVVCRDDKYRVIPTDDGEAIEKAKMWSPNGSIPDGISAKGYPLMWNINMSYQVNRKDFGSTSAIDLSNADTEAPAELGPQTFRYCYAGSSPSGGGGGGGDGSGDGSGSGTQFCEAGETQTVIVDTVSTDVENVEERTQYGRTVCYAENKTANLTSYSSNQEWEVGYAATEPEDFTSDFHVKHINDSTGQRVYWERKENDYTLTANYHDNGYISQCRNGSAIKQFWETNGTQKGKNTGCLPPNYPMCQIDSSENRCWGEGEVIQ